MKTIYIVSLEPSPCIIIMIMARMNRCIMIKVPLVRYIQRNEEEKRDSIDIYFRYYLSIYLSISIIVNLSLFKRRAFAVEIYREGVVIFVDRLFSGGGGRREVGWTIVVVVGGPIKYAPGPGDVPRRKCRSRILWK
jgi:hypothetical protein